MQRSRGQQHQSCPRTRTLNAELRCKVQNRTEKTLVSSVPLTLREARGAAHVLNFKRQDIRAGEPEH